MNNHIENTLEKLRGIFEATEARVENLNENERLPITVLAKELGDRYNMTSSTMYALLTLFLDGYPGIKRNRGAKGGIEKIKS